jgi:ParB family chromosome partitioning protein
MPMKTPEELRQILYSKQAGAKLQSYADTEAQPQKATENAVMTLLGLTPQTKGEEAEKAENPPTTYIGIDRLKDFPYDPFKPYDLEALTQSVKEMGVLSPVVVRPKGRDYEILSGHHRVRAARNAGLSTVPCVIINADDDTAALIVTDSNLRQRERILPSEKGRAFKMRLEAQKRRSGRKKANSSQIGTNLTTATEIGNAIGLDDNAIYRYIRMTHLIEPLQTAVDENVLPFISGVEVSYLKPEAQMEVYEFFFQDNKLPLEVKTAKAIKERAEETEITAQELEKIISKEKKEKKPTKWAVSFKKAEKYIPANTGKREAEKLILTALEFYEKYKDKVTEENL